MRTAICSISTRSHLFKTQALFDSLRGLTGSDFAVLQIDGEPDVSDLFSVYTLSDLDSSPALRIKRKYRGNALRWAMKPVFLGYLLEQGYDRVIYVDNDIFFFSSPDFLFGYLDTSSVLLTPHFYPADPNRDQNWLEANFRVGLYNAGFVGVSRAGAAAMQWWAECCAYNVKKSAHRGLFDDQKYLDLLPILFEGVKIVKHHGCNIAGWNRELSPRKQAEGKVTFAGDEPVFVHFNAFTIRQIIEGNDPLLTGFWENYLSVLHRFNKRYRAENELKRSWKDLFAYIRYLRFLVARKLEQ